MTISSAILYSVKPDADMQPIQSSIGLFDIGYEEISRWLYRTTKELGSGNLPSAYDHLKKLPDGLRELIEHVEERMLSINVKSVQAVLKLDTYEVVLRMTNPYVPQRELFVVHCTSDVNELQFSTFGLTADNNVWTMSVCEEI